MHLCFNPDNISLICLNDTDDTHNPLAKIRQGDSENVIESGGFSQVVLDLFEFDADATDLDLIVDSSQEVIDALLILIGKIPCQIPPGFA